MWHLRHIHIHTHSRDPFSSTQTVKSCRLTLRKREKERERFLNSTHLTPLGPAGVLEVSHVIATGLKVDVDPLVREFTWRGCLRTHERFPGGLQRHRSAKVRGTRCSNTLTRAEFYVIETASGRDAARSIRRRIGAERDRNTTAKFRGNFAPTIFRSHLDRPALDARRNDRSRYRSRTTGRDIQSCVSLVRFPSHCSQSLESHRSRLAITRLPAHSVSRSPISIASPPA